MFLKFLDSILPGSGAFIKTAVRAVQRGVESFVQSLRDDWVNVTSSQGGSSRPSDDIRHDINENDGEITDLEKKLRRDGQLNRSDQEQLDELRGQAIDLAEEHQQARSEETTSEILAETSEATATSLSQDYLHILDWSRGPAVRMKRCPICAGAMYINRRNKNDGSIITIKDYFWACTNYYHPKDSCRGTIPFGNYDIGLLHKSGTPELELKYNDFTLITSQKPVLKLIERKMSQAIGAQDIDMICPIHGLPLVLSAKEGGDNTLDIYSLRCPHFRCSQTRKLKDPAQLCSFLRRTTGESIL